MPCSTSLTRCSRRPTSPRSSAETGLGASRSLERMYQHWIDVHRGGRHRREEPRCRAIRTACPPRPTSPRSLAETGLSHELVARIHERLVEVRGKSPTREDLRRYAAYGAEHLGEGGFRLYLGMPADPDHPATPEALRHCSRSWRRRRRRGGTGGRRGPGRRASSGSATSTPACCTTPPYTPRSIAPHFVTLAGKRGIRPRPPPPTHPALRRAPPRRWTIPQADRRVGPTSQ